jgi:CRP-like cAMP-binding protein
MMQPAERLAALNQVPILAVLRPARLAQLAAECRWRDYAAGEPILDYRDPSTDVYFLAAGKVRVIIYSAVGKAVVFRVSLLKTQSRQNKLAARRRGDRESSAANVRVPTGRRF